MANASHSRTHRLPVGNIDLNTLLEELTPEQIDAHRSNVHHLSDVLYSCEIKERAMYGSLLLLLGAAIYWDVARLSGAVYYFVRVLLDLSIGTVSIYSYIRYQDRLVAEGNYWKAIFGDAYHD